MFETVLAGCRSSAHAGLPLSFRCRVQAPAKLANSKMAAVKDPSGASPTSAPKGRRQFCTCPGKILSGVHGISLGKRVTLSIDIGIRSVQRTSLLWPPKGLTAPRGFAR